MVHALTYVSESICNNGLMRSFWEAPCKQLVGLMTEWIGSRTQANQNLANIMYRREQKNHLIYCVKLPEVTEKDMNLPPRKRYLREAKWKYQEWLQEKCSKSASQCGKRTEDEYDSDLDSIMEEHGVHLTTLSDDDDEDKALKELMKQFLTPRKNSTLTRSQITKLCSFSLAQGYVDIPANERVKVTE